MICAWAVICLPCRNLRVNVISLSSLLRRLHSSLITLDYYTLLDIVRGLPAVNRICIYQSETKWQLGFLNIPCRTIIVVLGTAFMSKFCWFIGSLSNWPIYIGMPMHQLSSIWECMLMCVVGVNGQKHPVQRSFSSILYLC